MRVGMDDAAVTDIPMRLLIASVLTCLMVPLVMGAYEDLSRTVAEDRALKEMGRIARAARSVLDGEIGSSVEITVEARGFGSADFKEGTIGGPLSEGLTAEAFRMVFDLDIVGTVSTVPDPPIAMTGKDGTNGLMIGEGNVRLTVTHIRVDGVHAASFEIV